MKRTLTLKAEHLAELTTEELGSVVGAGPVTLDICPATIQVNTCSRIC